MTDRFNALTVALQKDIREDDAEAIINAITMIRGVISVTGNVVDIDTFTAEMRAINKVTHELHEVINKLNNKT